jgi:hypothetical protein
MLALVKPEVNVEVSGNMRFGDHCFEGKGAAVVIVQEREQTPNTTEEHELPHGGGGST